MKKLGTVLLSIVLVLSLLMLTGCGKDEQENEDVDNIDNIIIYSQLSEEEKQALVEEAASDNIKVEFGTDGTTLFTYEDGSTAVQTSDGVMTFTDINGGTAQIGGDWPDNEYTRMLGEPSFGTIAALSTEADAFTLAMADSTLEDVVAYANSIKAKGFDKNVEEYNESDMYSYEADNGNGYSISIYYVMNSFALSLERVTE